MFLSTAPPATHPGSIPWVFILWVAFMTAIVWLRPLLRWVQRKRSSNWPTTVGQIESAEVTRPKSFLVNYSAGGRQTPFCAEIRYSYSALGTSSSGICKRYFETEYEAQDFIRELPGKTVAVHYNPDKPAGSALSEPSLDTLLLNRPPIPESELSKRLMGEPIPDWLKPFLWLFAGLALLGLILSLWVHANALMGRRVAPEQYFFLLHAGIFVVFVPAVFVMQKRNHNMPSRNSWKVMLRGSPPWMLYMVYGFFAYAMINFAIFFWHSQSRAKGGSGVPADTWRGFSGLRMLFYSVAFAMLYSAATDNPSPDDANHPANR
jgi:hypothetical protein